MLSQTRYPDETLLEGLLLQPTIEGAAAYIGCDRGTIYRRLKNPNFADRLRKLRSERLDHIQSMIERTSQLAILELEKILVDPSTPPSVRVNAANAVLAQLNRARTDQ